MARALIAGFSRINVNGGSIAIGHPTGATAARLVMTLVSQLEQNGGGNGLATICGGVGEAEAVVVTVPRPDSALLQPNSRLDQCVRALPRLGAPWVKPDYAK
jgi:Thiolase, C-terminal domain